MEINNPELLTICVEEKFYPQHDLKEIVLLGRSNVGKSTFINKLCKRKKLAYISSNPGKTQTLNFYKVNKDISLVDVPGYGYAKVSKQKRVEFGNMIEEYLTKRNNLVFAILLIDFKVGPTKDDLIMFDFLRYYQIQVLIICTKVDKIKITARDKQKALIKKEMNILDDQIIYFYSSENKIDIEKIHLEIDQLINNAQIN